MAIWDNLPNMNSVRLAPQDSGEHAEPELKTYNVMWMCRYEAESPEQAAQMAWADMQRPGSTANCFSVIPV